MKKLKTHTLAFTNQKGGVAKTSSTMNVGAGLARMGYKVLMVDWDPQGNLTKAWGFAKQKGLKTLYSALRPGNEGFFDMNEVNPYAIKHYPENLFLLANSYDLAQFEGDFSTEVAQLHVLSKVLGKFEGSIDFILIDCQPSLSTLTANAYMASDYLLVPMEAEDFSEDGLNQILYMADQLNENMRKVELLIGGVFFTLHDRTVIAKSYVEHFKNDRKNVPQFETHIRRNVAIKECRQAPHRMDIFSYDKLISDQTEKENISIGTEDYYNLTQELLVRVGVKKKIHVSREEPKTEKVNGINTIQKKGDLKSDFKKFLSQKD